MRYKVSVTIETDADPSELLDLAQEFGEGLVDEHGGFMCDETGAQVEELEDEE